MKLRSKIIIAAITYITFMIYFTGLFLPVFYEATGGNEMVDLYLGDYSKSIDDIGQLIMDYGEGGRAYMLHFFIADSVYIVLSVLLFHYLIQAVTRNRYLSYIPFATGALDTLENLIVLYSGESLNMDYLIWARVFASAKGVTLLTSLIIIIGGTIRLIYKRVQAGKVSA